MTLSNATALLLLSSLPQSSSADENNTEPFPQVVNNSFVIEVVKGVYGLYKFRNFMFFITELISLDTDVALQFFHNLWITFPTAANIIIRNDRHYHILDGFLSTPSLVLILTTGAKDPIMKVASSNLRGMRELQTIFVLFPIMSTDNYLTDAYQYARFMNSIRTTYEWVWEHQFVNTVMITISNNVYILDPYPTLSIINKTDHWRPEDFFVDQSQNLKGFVVDTVISYDLPRVFKKRYAKQGHQNLMQISGTSGYMFTTFIETINATLDDSTNLSTELKPVNMSNIFTLIHQHLIDISIHSYTAMPGFDVGRSYPIGINDWCIMVPYRARSPEHLYLLHIFQDNTWLLICFSFVYISVAIWFCTADRSRDFSASLLQSLCSLLAIVPTSLLSAPTHRMRFLFFILFLLGFVLSNMFVSKLFSYLTSSPQQSQINTVQDVIESKLKIMIIDAEYSMIEDMPEMFPKKFLQQLQIVDKHVMDLHRDNLNTSFGYSVQSDRWRFLNMQQQFLRRPVFRLSQICIGPFYHVFPMRMDSHLSSQLKYFIMHASQSGFLEYWQEVSFADALGLRYVRMITVHEQRLPLSFRFFRSIWIFWWLGLILSGIVCAIEIKWQKRHQLKLSCERILSTMKQKYRKIRLLKKNRKTQIPVQNCKVTKP